MRKCRYLESGLFTALAIVLCTTLLPTVAAADRDHGKKKHRDRDRKEVVMRVDGRTYPRRDHERVRYERVRPERVRLKYELNGSGNYNLVPASAIEVNPYNDTLNIEHNTNPLAGQPAYTGPDLAGNGVWSEVRVNLFGLATAGDSIRLRLDFGVDHCFGEIGWYVDDVEFYRCSAELPPSACGNLKLDPGEQCDDGNDFIGDGCSNTCQVEAGWQCTAPKPPGEIGDPGFEAGTPNPSWAEYSLLFGTPLCDETACGSGTGSGSASGDWWAWFGGTAVGEPDDEEASLSQSVTIPATATELTFALEASACDSGAD